MRSEVRRTVRWWRKRGAKGRRKHVVPESYARCTGRGMHELSRSLARSMQSPEQHGHAPSYLPLLQRRDRHATGLLSSMQCNSLTSLHRSGAQCMAVSSPRPPFPACWAQAAPAVTDSCIKSTAHRPSCGAILARASPGGRRDRWHSLGGGCLLLLTHTPTHTFNYNSPSIASAFIGIHS